MVGFSARLSPFTTGPHLAVFTTDFRPASPAVTYFILEVSLLSLRLSTIICLHPLFHLRSKWFAPSGSSAGTIHRVEAFYQPVFAPTVAAGSMPAPDRFPVVVFDRIRTSAFHQPYLNALPAKAGSFFLLGEEFLSKVNQGLRRVHNLGNS